MSSRTRIAAVAVLAVSAVAFPGVARSAVVSSDGTTVTVTESTPGEANDITVSVDDPGTLRVYESFGPETPQGLCTYNAVTEIVECPLGPGGVQVSTGAGDDKVYSMLLGAGTLPDGAVVVEWPFKGVGYLVKEVLKEAGDAVVLEPPDAREAVLAAAERLLSPATR